MSGKWTSGPWVLGHPSSGVRVEYDGEYRNDGWIIAGEFLGPDAAANAKLCVSAPALAEALDPFDRALAWFESRMAEGEVIDEKTHMIGCEITVADLRAARAALALARGETK